MLTRVLVFAFSVVALATAYTSDIHHGMDPKDLIAKVSKSVVLLKINRLIILTLILNCSLY